jgi:hypothetical protein
MGNMGGAHSHRLGGDHDDVEVEPVPRLALLSTLAACAVATVVGVALLWPHGDRTEELKGSLGFAAEGVTFPMSTIESVEKVCPPTGGQAIEPGQEPGIGLPADPADQKCGRIHVRVDDGVDEGVRVAVQVPPEVSRSGLARGDRLELVRTPGADDQPTQISYHGIPRDVPLVILAVLFAAIVIVVARLRGLLALAGLAFAAVVFGVFLLPALLTGESAPAVALVGATAIMFVFCTPRTASRSERVLRWRARSGGWPSRPPSAGGQSAPPT